MVKEIYKQAPQVFFFHRTMQKVSIRPNLIPLTNHISWAVLFVSLAAVVCLPH